MLNETNERKWSVYLHIVPKEITRYPHDKYYVGLVKGNPSNRWRDGKGYRTQLFYRAIQKYGWNNIQHLILLEGLTKNEAKEYEKMYIAFYKSNDSYYGYNISKGGDDHTDMGEPIAQYTLNGDFVRVYNGIAEAAEKNNWCRVLMEGITSHGYQWKYVRDFDKLPEKIPSVRKCTYSRLIDVYDLFGNYIRTFDSLKDAIQFFGITSLNMRHDRPTIVLNQWQVKYSDDGYQVTSVKDMDYISCPVYCYSIEGIFLAKFDNKKVATKQMGLYSDEYHRDDYNIPNSVFYNLYNNCFKGYRWTRDYYEELPQLIEVTHQQYPVVQLDLSFNLIDIYPDTSEVSSKYRRNKNTKSHTDNIGSVCRENVVRYKSKQRLRTAYGYIWFKFIDIERSEIKISDLYLLRKYYIYDRIINDLERRNEKKCRK